MQEKDVVTRTAQILDILPGDPPRILTGERLTRAGQAVRMFQQMIPVPDGALFKRFTGRVSKGDEVEVTVTTEWCSDGYTTFLNDFTAAEAGKERGFAKIAL